MAVPPCVAEREEGLQEREKSGSGAKLAVQVSSASIVTCPSEQSGSPLQPAKDEPVSGVMKRVTEEPKGNEAEQVLPQEIPDGLLVTVPFPVPLLFTVKVKVEEGTAPPPPPQAVR